jgi:hypothetical protein
MILKMDLKELECEGMQWIHLAQDRNQWPVLVNRVTKLQIPQNSVNCLKS